MLGGLPGPFLKQREPGLAQEGPEAVDRLVVVAILGHVQLGKLTPEGLGLLLKPSDLLDQAVAFGAEGFSLFKDLSQAELVGLGLLDRLDLRLSSANWSRRRATSAATSPGAFLRNS